MRDVIPWAGTSDRWNPNSLTTNDVSKVDLDPESEQILPTFVAQAKNNVSLKSRVRLIKLTKPSDRLSFVVHWWLDWVAVFFYGCRHGSEQNGIRSNNSRSRLEIRP